MSEMKKEFTELKSKEQISFIKKIDDKAKLQELEEATEYLTVKDAISKRISMLQLVEEQEKIKNTKDGIDRSELPNDEPKKKKKRPANIFNWDLYGPPLSPERKAEILRKYNDEEYED